MKLKYTTTQLFSRILFETKTVRKILICLALFFIQGCGKKQIDSEFVPYLKVFEVATGISVDIHMRFTETLEDDIAGKCMAYPFYREVLISKEAWISINNWSKEYLILHELAHCVLNRGHMPRAHISRNNSCPNSVMIPGLPLFCYELNKAYYLNELKDTKSKPSLDSVF